MAKAILHVTKKTKHVGIKTEEQNLKFFHNFFDETKFFSLIISATTSGSGVL